MPCSKYVWFNTTFVHIKNQAKLLLFDMLTFQRQCPSHACCRSLTANYPRIFMLIPISVKSILGREKLVRTRLPALRFSIGGLKNSGPILNELHAAFKAFFLVSGKFRHSVKFVISEDDSSFCCGSKRVQGDKILHPYLSVSGFSYIVTVLSGFCFCGRSAVHRYRHWPRDR